MNRRFIIGVRPRGQTAQHNIESWSVVAAIMDAYGGASISDLAAAVSQHRHESGGLAFIDYCINLGWLKEDVS